MPNFISLGCIEDDEQFLVKRVIQKTALLTSQEPWFLLNIMPSEDLGFKPDSYLLGLKLTDICNKGEFETNSERLEKVVRSQFKKKYILP